MVPQCGRGRTARPKRLLSDSPFRNWQMIGAIFLCSAAGQRLSRLNNWLISTSMSFCHTKNLP